MSSRDDQSPRLDSVTNTSICRAIGERLSRDLGPDTQLPSSLQRLIDEMHRQETAAKATR